VAQPEATQVEPEQANVVPLVVGQMAQAPPHARYPALHDRAHDPSSQMATPFGEPGQDKQALPQLVTLLFGTQVPEQR